MLMQLWKPELELVGISSGSWCHCLPITTCLWLWEKGCTVVVCKAACCMEVRPAWPVRKENVVALQRAEMRMVRWMCSVKLKDRLPSNRLRWYEHVCPGQTAVKWLLLLLYSVIMPLMHKKFVCAVLFTCVLDMMKYCFNKILFQLTDWSCYLHCWSSILLSSGA